MRNVKLEKSALELWANGPDYAPRPARGALLSPITKVLREQPRVPDELGDSLAPLRWLIQRAEAGIPLDREAMPASGVLDDACERFRWKRFDYGSAQRNTCAQFWLFYKMAYRLRAIRVKEDVALQAPPATSFLEDGCRLWEGLCLQLALDESAFGAIVELFLAVLLQDGEVDEVTLENRFNATLQEELGHEGELAEILPQLSRCWNFAEVFVCVGRALGWFADLDRCFPKLSTLGEASALLILRAAAMNPCRSRYLHDLESPLMPDGPALRPAGSMSPDEAWWEPLEEVLPFERCHDFMYMYNDGVIHHYKHWQTRRYLHLDERGNAYAYVGEGLGHKRIPLKRAISEVFR